MMRLHLNEIGDVLIELIGRRERASDHLRFGLGDLGSTSGDELARFESPVAWINPPTTRQFNAAY